MKALDDITCTEIDFLVARADLGFGYDERPIVAGELGAGIFAPVDGEPEPEDDTALFEANDKPDWLLEAGF
ncbi:hypothetical protein AB0K92_15865 [Streptomyces sp. NPDC052687]|uniref:hypothetical protein n=1 Tax=Streptomyces sp. NPDC052687 TaxID=3154759 RepID=UPI003428EF02